MKKAFPSLVLLLFTTGLWAQPLPVKLQHTVIIDTDCGMDDMRAISLLLARPEITIKAIITSDGSLSPVEGAEKVRSLLHEFGRDTIPVAAGNVINGIDPPWRAFNKGIRWGSRTGGPAVDSNGADCISRILNSENEKITVVCLGPLTNVGKAIRKDAGLPSEIERIIWYNKSVKPLQGFNYDCDKESAGELFRSGIRIDVISNLDKDNALFDTSMYAVCRQSKTPLARVLYNVFSQQSVMEKLKVDHFKLCDDLVALYLTNPELFDMNTDMDKLNVRYDVNYDITGIREAMSDMIKGSYVARHNNIVFNRFPDQPEMFNYDIRPIIDSAITRYGKEEWKAVVMTDEFHGHLGVFSVVGAKMGIKARELFGVGPDMLEVTSYAGSKPPYSCLNDGIQVSTGATVGMGLIHLADVRKTRPSAVFTYKNRSFRISLKKEYLEQVDADINEGIAKFGLMDDGYWKLIRQNAIKYWVEWDRNKIFYIEEIHSLKQDLR